MNPIRDDESVDGNYRQILAEWMELGYSWVVWKEDNGGYGCKLCQWESMPEVSDLEAIGVSGGQPTPDQAIDVAMEDAWVNWQGYLADEYEENNYDDYY